jgi:hypothetical protein
MTMRRPTRGANIRICRGQVNATADECAPQSCPTSRGLGCHNRSVERVLLDEMIDTDYGQFDLLWGHDYGFDGDFDRVFAGQVNGLAGAASGQGLYLNLARRSGGSQVRIVLLQDAPAISEDDGWEDVVEVAIRIPHDAEPRWCTWAGEESGPLDIPQGSYRVRVSARGRDAGADGAFADGAVDFYLLEIWPAPTQPDSIIRSTSANAEYWHREVGNRR